MTRLYLGALLLVAVLVESARPGTPACKAEQIASAAPATSGLELGPVFGALPGAPGYAKDSGPVVWHITETDSEGHAVVYIQTQDNFDMAWNECKRWMRTQKPGKKHRRICLP